MRGSWKPLTAIGFGRCVHQKDQKRHQPSASSLLYLKLRTAAAPRARTQVRPPSIDPLSIQSREEKHGLCLLVRLSEGHANFDCHITGFDGSDLGGSSATMLEPRSSNQAQTGCTMGEARHILHRGTIRGLKRNLLRETDSHGR